jgi:hypothetical protein
MPNLAGNPKFVSRKFAQRSAGQAAVQRGIRDLLKDPNSNPPAEADQQDKKYSIDNPPFDSPEVGG